MKQFYELYAENEKVSTLLTQLSWSNHLLIMSGAKSDEEREFYMRLSIKERYSYRELERQIQSAYGIVGFESSAYTSAGVLFSEFPCSWAEVAICSNSEH